MNTITVAEARAKVLLTVGLLVGAHGWASADTVRAALLLTDQIRWLSKVRTMDLLADLMTAGLIAREPGFEGTRVVLTTAGLLALGESGGEIE